MNRTIVHRDVSLFYHLMVVQSEIRKTRIRMWIAFICSLTIAAMVGASVRRQPWIDLEWYWTPIAAISVMMVCFWLGDKMFHKRDPDLRKTPRRKYPQKTAWDKEFCG